LRVHGGQRSQSTVGARGGYADSRAGSAKKVEADLLHRSGLAELLIPNSSTE
jgi:hypothetical protein